MLNKDDQIELINLFQQLRVFLRLHELDETERALSFLILCGANEMKGDENPAVNAYREVARGFDVETILNSAQNFQTLVREVTKERIQ